MPIVSKLLGKQPAWFPDWHGLPVAIVASGPSTKGAGVALLERRIPTFAIKENVQICPWAEAVYGCDRAWWRNERGLPNYHGLKISATAGLSADWPGIKIVKVDPPNDRILTSEPGLIGSGGNSGFQALNLAVQFGAKRILLIGYDMSDQYGQHWYGPNRGEGRSNPGSWNFSRWIKAFETAAITLRSLDIDVVNASAFTALKCFPKVTVETTLKAWHL